MLKQILHIIIGIFIVTAVASADVNLKEGHPQFYIVKKGDTLWDISAQFLDNPWLWPEIWHANPQVKNPHLIYPGDRLELSYRNGKPVLSRVGDDVSGTSELKTIKLSPTVRREDISAIPAIPLADVNSFLVKTKVMSSQEEIDALPYVVSIIDDHLHASEQQEIYVRGLGSIALGSRVQIVRPTYEFREMPEQLLWKGAGMKTEAISLEQDEVFTRPSWWWINPISYGYKNKSRVLGIELLEMAQAEVVGIGGEISTLKITQSMYDVKVGDHVLINGNVSFDLQFQPHIPQQVPENMRILASTDVLNAVGSRQVVALSKGTIDGVENGQVYAIARPGKKIEDRPKTRKFSRLRAMIQAKENHVQLPDQQVGHLIIFRTFENVSYGLIMDAKYPIKLLDELRKPDEIRQL